MAANLKLTLLQQLPLATISLARLECRFSPEKEKNNLIIFEIIYAVFTNVKNTN